MAKLSAINKNKSRIKLSDRLFKKRQALKKIVEKKKLKEQMIENKNFVMQIREIALNQPRFFVGVIFINN